MAQSKFSLYLSHSWRPGDVDLNLHVWGLLHAGCNLLVDQNTGAEPPYYINRIEEYIRRTDLFLAVLTHRADATDLPNCSKAALFEVRLAERARKPRFVLYERGCGFAPPEQESDLVRYVGFDRHALLTIGNSNANRAVHDWLRAVKASLRPRELMLHEASLALLPGSARDVLPVLQSALSDGGYPRTRRLDAVTTDFEILNKLATTGLLVADVTTTELPDAMAMAHAVFLPTIRIARRAADGAAPALPWFLRGHPEKGYESDIVFYDRAEDLHEPVRERARAMVDTRELIVDDATARQFFQRRRWKPHGVFVSHALKAPQRRLVDELMTRFADNAVDAWEYVRRGESGRDWREQLDKNLAATTHAVVLVDDGFNDSDNCCDELESLQQPERDVEFLPFQLAGCDARAVQVRGAHHQALPADPAEAAEQIVEATLRSLAP